VEFYQCLSHEEESIMISKWPKAVIEKEKAKAEDLIKIS
jgi:hypothetical protein